MQARLEDEREYVIRRAGASIYPAVQNLISPAAPWASGTLITTNHMLYENEVKALLGLPDEVQTYALMPIGYPEGSFGPVKRRPLSEVVPPGPMDRSHGPASADSRGHYNRTVAITPI